MPAVGPSHQLNGARAGFNNEKWDKQFLDLIARNPKKLAAMRRADYIRKTRRVPGAR